MKLTILGSGTAVPHPQRASSGHWLETSSGTILLDASSAVVHRIAQEQFDWVNLDAVWISHFHLDHVGGLAPFLFGTKHAPQTRFRTKPLTILGPSGLKQLLRKFDEAGDYRILDQPFPVEIREVAPQSRFEVLPELLAEAFSTPHTMESLAIRISDRTERSIVYTSDTGYADSLGSFASETDLLLMECSFFRDKPIDTHLELRDAMLLAEKARARKVVLTHLYPEWDGIDLVNQAKKLWPGETIEAKDGLRIDV
jgi:ribonuclease BN (tRNA processing enzyme)